MYGLQYAGQKWNPSRFSKAKNKTLKALKLLMRIAVLRIIHYYLINTMNEKGQTFTNLSEKGKESLLNLYECQIVNANAWRFALEDVLPGRESKNYRELIRSLQSNDHLICLTYLGYATCEGIIKKKLFHILALETGRTTRHIRNLYDIYWVPNGLLKENSTSNHLSVAWVIVRNRLKKLMRRFEYHTNFFISNISSIKKTNCSNNKLLESLFKSSEKKYGTMRKITHGKKEFT